MAEKKMCPHCGGTLFMGAITRACIVEVFAPDKDGDEESYNVSKETKDKYSIDVVKCIRCKRDVTKDELITGVTCKECGRPVAPSDLNKDGICSVCEAKKTRSELANASQDDLIRMLLEAEKRSSSVAEKISKKVEKAEEVASTSATEDTTSEDAETEKEESKGKTSDKDSGTKKRAKAPRGRKKNTNETVEGDEEKSETVEESTEQPVEEVKEAEVVAEEDVKKAVDDIANSQEAPFPDFPGMNAPESEPVAAPAPEEGVNNSTETPSEEDVNAPEPFQMFDENEEPF